MNSRTALLLTLTLAAGTPLRSQIAAMKDANTIGIFRQDSSGLTAWFVDSNGDRQYDGGDATYWFGLNGDIPILGDWTNTNHLQLGIFRNGYWYVDWNDNQQWDSSDQIYAFGLPGDVPVVGDWDHSGVLRIGVYRIDPSTGLGYWIVNLHTCTDSYGCNYGGTTGVATQGVDYDVFQFGLAGDIPVVGDWDHSGVLRVGVYRPSAGVWIQNMSACNDYSCGSIVYNYFNPLGGQPVMGDWTATGVTLNPGFFLNGQWDVQANGYTMTYYFGQGGDVAVVGPWSAMPSGLLTVTTTSLPATTQGVPYAQPLSASGGSPNYTWSWYGNTPPGLALSNGTITGTPTASGTYSFMVQVTDSANHAVTQNLSLFIWPPPLSISAISPTSGTPGSLMTISGASFGATQGSSAIYFWGSPFTAATNILSWSSNTIQVMVPTGLSPGSSYFVGVAVNGFWGMSPVPFLTLGPPPDFTLSVTPATATVLAGAGTAYTATVATVNGFNGTVTFSASGLPAGATATFSPATIARSGSTTMNVTTVAGAATGTYTLAITASSGALTHSSQASLSIIGSPSITSISPTSGPPGTPVIISGTNFGAAQGASTVTFNGVTAGTASSWSATSITVSVPTGASSGSVVVTAGGLASNGVLFVVIGLATLSSPANGAINQPFTPTLTWSASTGATSYDVYLGASTPALVGTVSGTSFTPSPALSANTSYAWYVIAKSTAGSAPPSSTWFFTTAPPPPPTLIITSSHTGSFTQAQTGAAYSLTVSNTGSGPTDGTAVAVTAVPPGGLLPTAISGSNWTCTQPVGPCLRSDVLATGASYPAITLTVSVSPNAAASVTNQVTVSGGGSGSASASDPTTISALLRYANPLAFATTASIVGGVATNLTVTYTSDNGPRDIASGQVQIDDCYLSWDSSGNVHLYSAVPAAYPDAVGVLGQPVSLFAGSCTINLNSSTLTTPTSNPKALVLSLNIVFAEQQYLAVSDSMIAPDFVGPHEVYAWGVSGEGLNTGQVDLGSLVVSQGQDFTLNVVGSETINIAQNSSATLTVNAVGLNGFTGSIALGFEAFPSPPATTCISVSIPQSMSTGSQTTVQLWNSCPVEFNAALLHIHGTAIGIRHVASNALITVNSTAAGDFTVGVGTPTPAVLTPQSSVTYPVTVSSVNGLAGSVSLSVSGLPAGVTDTLSPTQVSVNGYGTATSLLTVLSSVNTPFGASYLPTVTGVMGGTSHVAVFTLATQVTTFQVTSATGSAIVHNTGQEVQVTHTVPTGNGANITTCSSVDPNVTCRVVSSSAGTVVIGITASTSAAHGTRAVNLNSGAMTSQVAVADDFGGTGLPTITVQAGGYQGVDISFPDAPCYVDGPCGYFTLAGAPSWMSGLGGGDLFLVTADPPADTQPGSFSYWVNLCSDAFEPDDVEIDGCAVGPGDVEVTAAPAPTCTPSVGIVLHGSTTDISKSRRSVAGGQLVLLDSSILNSCNQEVTQYQWQIVGTVASDWQGVDANGNPTGQSPDDNSAGPPIAPAINAQGVVFAWTDSGKGNNVTVKVTFADGSSASTSATFDVYVPTANATMRAGNVYVDYSSQTYPGKVSLYFTIYFAFTNPQGPSGDYEWVQVVNNALFRRHDSTGWSRASISGLDTDYPYQKGPLNSANTGDQPVSQLQVGYDQYSRSDDFTMTLMFRPSAAALGSTNRPTNIWIPLNGYEWKWSGSAQSSDGGQTWTKVAGSSDPPASLTNSDLPRLKTYPTWTTNAGDQLAKGLVWVKE